MKKIYILLYLVSASAALSQTMQYLGLEGKNITSLCVNFNFIATGTEKDGMFWKPESQITEEEWQNVELDKKILTVYPHKSGPIGWAIGAGVESNLSDSGVVYCSFMGQPFRSISSGIDYSRTYGVFKLDGFPDPTICGETYAVTGDALYRRNFTDTTWTMLREAYEGSFLTVKVKENNPGVVMLGGAVGFAGILVSKSTDFGDTWKDISPLGAINDIDFTGDSAQTIFACAYSEVFRTTDDGRTWNKIFVNSDSYVFTQILYEPFNNVLYVSGFDNSFENTKPVLLYSVDKGDTFEEIKLDFTDEIVDLELSSINDDWIYLATKNEGVFRFKSNIVKVEDESSNTSPENFVLLQNYPNPFNPSTMIEYTLHTPAFGIHSREGNQSGVFVTLKVYDILGREVEVLINEVQPPGNYQVTFDGSNYGSGIYYCRIQSGDYSHTIKLVLIK